MSETKKDDSIFSMIKLGLILAAYAAVSCTVLALVNNVTSTKIAQNQTAKINAAMKDFFPEEGLNFNEAQDFAPASKSTIKIEKVYIASKDSQVKGGAVQVSGPTYDNATILVGVTTDGTVTGVKFLKNTDSPGFGLKASDSTFTLPNGKTFYGQFTGKNANKGFILNETFDAISGATITSAGVAELLTEGTQCLLKEFSK